MYRGSLVPLAGQEEPARGRATAYLRNDPSMSRTHHIVRARRPVKEEAIRNITSI